MADKNNIEWLSPFLMTYHWSTVFREDRQELNLRHSG